MKKFATMVTSVALIGAMVAGGSLAYLSDTDSAVNVMELGSVNIEQIEQERNAEGKLVDFTQGKPLLPYVGELGWKNTDVDNGAYRSFTMNNVVDKYVSVKNTGKSDAYVRTIIALEMGEYTTVEDFKYKVVGTATNAADGAEFDFPGTWVWGTETVAQIDGQNYMIMEAVHQDVVKKGETTIPSLLQVYMNKACNNAEVKKVDGNVNGTYDILVLSQAVQANGFEAVGAAEALNEAFGKTAEKAAEWFGGMTVVTSDNELKKAIENANVTTIYVDGNLTFDWGGDSYENSKALAMKGKTIAGLDATASITFKGYGSANPITDVTLKDITVYDETVGDDETAWEHGYLEFENLTAENVVFADSIMLDGTCELTDCSVPNEVSSWYGAWVEGGNVTFNNCEFTGTRGIKIHEAYGSEVKSVRVDNCTFELSEKPGVVIGTLNADTTVKITNSAFATQSGDQGLYIYESDTTITDFKFSENNNTIVKFVEDNTGLDAAIKAGETDIYLRSGETYIIPDSAQGKTLTFIGGGDTVIATQDDGSYEGCDYSLDGATVTFKNITINTDSTTYTGYARCNGTYENCVINGTYTLYGDSTFKNCTFNVSGDVYNIWTWGAPNATFENCTFNSDGKAVLLYGTVNTNLTVDGCTFNDNGGLTDLKAAIEIGNDYGKSYTLTVNNTTVNGYEINDKGINTGTTLWANKNSMGTDKLNVVVDGVDVY
ncbi:MAG: hypothetical protein IJE67_02965 [Peptococcaceae bacterium]|nr:hypothetical protein [Peptococcaceae bacterium]